MSTNSFMRFVEKLFWNCQNGGLKFSIPIHFFFLFTQKVLAAHGAAKVSAYVTHGVFPKNSWERFTHKNNGKYL